MSFAKIRPRRGTATQWETANPILAEGEIGIEVPNDGVGTGEVKIKFGDGVKPWTDLPYGVDTSVKILNGVNVLEITEKGVYFVTEGEGLPPNLPQSSGRTGYLFVDSLVYDGAERRTIKWIPYASNYPWYNTYFGTWTGWVSPHMSSISSSSELTLPSGVSMYHHLQICVQNDVIRISMGIQTTVEIKAYGTVLTVPEGKRGWRDTGVIITSLNGTVVRPAWYNHTNGIITMLGATLPTGNYFIIGS